jgi:hypothetical protein
MWVFQLGFEELAVGFLVPGVESERLGRTGALAPREMIREWRMV